MLTQPLAIADARLLARLRRGEPAALDQLWADQKHALWSVCLSLAGDRDQARALLSQTYAGLGTAARGWGADLPVCCQVAAHLWRVAVHWLELPRLDGIDPVPPQQFRAPDPARIAELLAGVPPHVRLAYLLDLFFGCPASLLAELAGLDEVQLRAARAAAVWQLMAGGEGGPPPSAKSGGEGPRSGHAEGGPPPSTKSGGEGE